jgi:hypothetical protein
MGHSFILHSRQYYSTGFRKYPLSWIFSDGIFLFKYSKGKDYKLTNEYCAAAMVSSEQGKSPGIT